MRAHDTFLVVAHVHAAQDSAGNCYDWYTIDRHSHYEERDRGPELEQLRADVDYIAVMQGVEL